ncbi:unnamed protein product [Lampetra planeri]
MQSSPNDQHQRCSCMATVMSLLFVMNTILAIALVTSNLFIVHTIQSVATNFQEEQLLIVDHQDVQTVIVESLEQQINAKMSGMKEQVDQLKDQVRILNENKAFQVDLAYVLLKEQKTHADARKYCQGIRGDLANPKSLFQNNQLHKLIEDISYIGINDIDNENNFVYADGTPLGQFMNWDKNEPNNMGEEDCVGIKSNGMWNDITCLEKFPFFCEIPKNNSST